MDLEATAPLQCRAGYSKTVRGPWRDIAGEKDFPQWPPKKLLEPPGMAEKCLTNF